MHISCIIFAPLWGLFLSSHILRICQWVLWFKHKFSRCDGRRRTFSFSRKICKSALALISRPFVKLRLQILRIGEKISLRLGDAKFYKL